MNAPARRARPTGVARFTIVAAGIACGAAATALPGWQAVPFGFIAAYVAVEAGRAFVAEQALRYDLAKARRDLAVIRDAYQRLNAHYLKGE